MTGGISPRKKVIIIGAGLAGLACAYELNEAGHEVVVLEVRDRPGGRVETLRQPFSGDAFAEAGAYWISDRHATVCMYLRKLGVINPKLAVDNKHILDDQNNLGELVPSTKRLLYHINGNLTMSTFDPQRDRFPDITNSIEQRMGIMGIIDACLRPVCDEAAASGWASADLKKYDSMSFYDFLSAPHSTRLPPPANIYMPSDAAINYMSPWFGGFDDLDKVSALALIRDGALSQGMCDQVQPRWFTLKNGMDSFPTKFAEKLGHRIRYNAQVVALRRNANSVTATYKLSRNPALQTSVQAQEESADHLVCALPFSVLRHIEVTPSFSPPKQKVIQNLKYASVVRVCLQCRSSISELENGSGYTDFPKDHDFDLPPEACGMNFTDMTYTQEGKQGTIISAYMVGSLARKVKAMPESKRIDFVIGELGKIHSDIAQVVDREHCMSRSWDDEPWTNGAYARFGPGELSLLMPNIANDEWEGCVHFAGDHTSDSPGWMEGALQSGRRAAHEIDPNISSTDL